MTRKVTAAHESMRLSEHGRTSSDPVGTHCVVAVDSNGDVMFESEALTSDRDVKRARNMGQPTGEWPEGVDHYEVRQRA